MPTSSCYRIWELSITANPLFSGILNYVNEPELGDLNSGHDIMAVCSELLNVLLTVHRVISV
jgi:hypothetical protein